MPIRPDCIRRPLSPIARTFVPDGSEPYHVQDGDSWVSLARRLGIEAWHLIRFNYPGLPPDVATAAREVNWYLQEYVGCRSLSADGKNYRFSASANPGIIYLPNKTTKPEETTVSTPTVSYPLLASIKERRESIINNTPGIIRIEENGAIAPYPNLWYVRPERQEVSFNWVYILKSAQRRGLDPDFVAAIIWMESTHGWYDEYIPNNKTIRPMNVHAKLWKQLGVSRSDLEDPEKNIEAGNRILAAIWERTEDPTYEKVATLYNQLGAESVNAYGKTVCFYMKQKPWGVLLGTSFRQWKGKWEPPSPKLKRWESE